MALDQQEYRKFADENPDLPLFQKGWWLDTVVGKDNWNAVILKKGNHIVASFPFVNKKMGPFRILTMPPLTPYLGIWLQYPPGQKYVSRLSFEKQVMEEIINQMPPFHYFVQNFYPTITNWLPFYWKNFQQTTKYTYRIFPENNEEILWKNLKENIRREIKKAEKRVKIMPFEDIAQFFEINKKSFSRQNKTIPHSFSLIEKLYTKVQEYQSGKMYVAKDESGNLHAAHLLVWDHATIYYLVGGGDPEFRNSGAHSLLMWESIKMASMVGKIFDFEGSMLPHVERFFSSFGAIQTPYFKITKPNSKLVQLADMGLDFFNLKQNLAP